MAKVTRRGSWRQPRPKTSIRSSARYNTAWEKARSAFLAEAGNHFCIRCKERGLLNPGTMRMDGSLETNPRRMHLVVDHIKAHRGDQRLFWDRTNWQPLCPDHHDIAKQQEEHGKVMNGSDINGRPLAVDHPWNR